MFGGLLQPAHLLVILLVLVLVLGPSRLHGLGRQLGASWRALVAGVRAGARGEPPQVLPARRCPRCDAWSGEPANYCTRCGAALG